MSLETDSANNTEQEAYAENSALTVLLGDNPKIKILAAMLSESDRDLNPSDIARLAGVSRNTVYRHLDELLNLEVVVRTREIGTSKMYQINKDSDIAENLASIEWDLVRMMNGIEEESHND